MRTYLDHNATSVLRPEAKAAMVETLEAGGNPSSVHAEGRGARRRVDLAREQVAMLVGARPEMVIFTSGGTEANNQALRGTGAERLIISATEHPAVVDGARGTGLPVDLIAVDGNGMVDLEALEALLQADDGQALISVMTANNETGVLQPVQEIVQLAGNYNALVHTDAVQAAGKITVSFPLLGVDMLTLSAHKLGGTQGVGALVVRDGLELSAMVLGGGQELRRRGGTENVPGIVGFGAAAAAAHSELSKAQSKISKLRDDLQAKLLENSPHIHIFSGGAERLPNTVCFAHPDMPADTLLIGFDLEGVAVSSGSACSSGKVAKSPVLTAMGADSALASGAIRVSLGWNSNVEDVEQFARAWNKIAARHKARKAA
ncbi:MAG: cysteine desulfurase [Alphaproteobacteria bacterium]|nr:cysteine desulfurase [Alphaproteobacteria bacterium]